MKHLILPIVLLILIQVCLLFFRKEPEIIPETQKTATATVLDRAISDQIPYLGVSLSDGQELCLWDPTGKRIPENVEIGDVVEVSYGQQNGFDRHIILQITE